ncbi:unnamed protein product, partial [Heterosigma akashiwo]
DCSTDSWKLGPPVLVYFINLRDRHQQFEGPPGGERAGRARAREEGAAHPPHRAGPRGLPPQLRLPDVPLRAGVFVVAAAE